MARSQVRSPPLHRPDDEVLVSDDRGYPVLDEPVAEGDERPGQAPLHERTKGGLEVGRFQGYEGEIEGAFEARGVRTSVDGHVALFAQFVEQEPGVLHPLDMFFVGVKHACAAYPALHPRRRHTADGARPDYEDAGVYHVASPDPASTGGRSSKRSLSAA